MPSYIDIRFKLRKPIPRQYDIDKLFREKFKYCSLSAVLDIHRPKYTKTLPYQNYKNCKYVGSLLRPLETILNTGEIFPRKISN